MKNLLLIISLLYLPCIGVAQDWILMGIDPSDDLVDTDHTDLLLASYNIEDDSIYFLLVSNLDYFPFEPGFGIAIGIDTNLIADDGLTNWGGINQSMKPDVQKIIVTNSAFPDFLPSEIKSISENKDSLILQFHLEEIDMDRYFNVIFGTGIYNLTEGGMVYDEAPNESYFTIDETISTTVNTNFQLGINIYPNPSSDIIYIGDSHLIQEIQIFDFGGRSIRSSYPYSNGYIDIANLIEGEYFILIKSPNHTRVVKFVKL